MCEKNGAVSLLCTICCNAMVIVDTNTDESSKVIAAYSGGLCYCLQCSVVMYVVVPPE